MTQTIVKMNCWPSKS